MNRDGNRDAVHRGSHRGSSRIIADEEIRGETHLSAARDLSDVVLHCLHDDDVLLTHLLHAQLFQID